jgi:DNA polymerase-3 subunit delta'
VTAESAERLLPTIASRCEILRLRPAPPEQLAQELQRLKGVSPEKAHLVAQLSAGRPGFAMQLLADPHRLAIRETRLDELARLLTASRGERFAYANTLAKDRLAMRETLSIWLSYWRDIMLLTSGSAASATNPDRLTEIKTLAASLDLKSVHHFVQSLENTFDLLERNVNLRLACEVLLLELPSLSTALEMQT